MTITSGPNIERLIRNTLFFLMIAGFAGFFLYDGYRGYEAANFEEHLNALETADRDKARNARVYPAVNSEAATTLAEKLERALGKVTPAAQRRTLEAEMGGPPSFETPTALYYFGPDYRIRIASSGGRLREPSGKKTAHTVTDLYYQKVLGWGLSGAAALSGLVLFSIILTKCQLDDTGLSYRFKGRASWDEMKSLETSRFTKKGWIDLVCGRSGGGERRIRLDEYHLKRFAEIVQEICRRKGFEDPVEKEKLLKAEKAAG